MSCSVNVVVTAESTTVPSAVLDKDLFAECLTKNTRQSLKHSAKSQIWVVKHSHVMAKLYSPQRLKPNTPGEVEARRRHCSQRPTIEYRCRVRASPLRATPWTACPRLYLYGYTRSHSRLLLQLIHGVVDDHMRAATYTLPHALLGATMQVRSYARAGEQHRPGGSEAEARRLTPTIYGPLRSSNSYEHVIIYSSGQWPSERKLALSSVRVPRCLYVARLTKLKRSTYWASRSRAHQLEYKSKALNPGQP